MSIADTLIKEASELDAEELKEATEYAKALIYRDCSLCPQQKREPS